MYSFESRVRYSEIDNKGKLNLGALINYFQDCSNFQSDLINQGVEELATRGRSWFLCSWHIEIDELPKSGENISVSTWPTSFKGLYGSRNYCIKNENGMIVKASSIWALMDMETYHPAKITEEDIAGYVIEPALDMPKVSRKIKVEAEGEAKEQFRVRKMNLDTNNHVNNGQYIQMAMEYLPEDCQVVGIRVEYRKAAMYNDVIVPKVYFKDEIYTITLNDVEDNIYATIQFRVIV